MLALTTAPDLQAGHWQAAGALHRNIRHRALHGNEAAYLRSFKQKAVLYLRPGYECPDLRCLRALVATRPRLHHNWQLTHAHDAKLQLSPQVVRDGRGVGPGVDDPPFLPRPSGLSIGGHSQHGGDVMPWRCLASGFLVAAGLGGRPGQLSQQQSSACHELVRWPTSLPGVLHRYQAKYLCTMDVSNDPAVKVGAHGMHASWLRLGECKQVLLCQGLWSMQCDLHR